MRCDNCPLCPIAEDDVCLESEGKYGIEHADGMLGCKHPRNWAEKRSNEHDTALGEMGTDMGIEMDFTPEELLGKYRDADSAFDDVYAIGFYLRTSGGECVTICWLDEYKNDFDIIGNIHDTPELLEVSGDEA